METLYVFYSRKLKNKYLLIVIVDRYIEFIICFYFICFLKIN